MAGKFLTFPQDVDGDVLRSVQSRGSDMSKPMVIDFAVDAPSEAAADFCVARLAERGFRSSKSDNEEDGRWTVNVPVIMTPNHREIVDFQQALDEDLGRFGAKSDGWGTFGNNPDNLYDDLKKALK